LPDKTQMPQGKNWLYTATEKPDGSVTVAKTKISQQQFQDLRNRFNNLDNNGNDIPPPSNP